MSTLTKEQQSIIDEKRKQALAIREAKRLKTEPSVTSYFAPLKKPEEVTIVKEIRSMANISVMPQPVVKSQPSVLPQPMVTPTRNSQPASKQNPGQSGTSQSVSRPPSQSPFSRPQGLSTSANPKPKPYNNSPTSSYGSSSSSSNKSQTNSQPSSITNGQTKQTSAPIFSNASKIRVKISLAPMTRFILEFGYNAGLIEAIKKIPTCRYDRDTARWSFHINDYLKTIETLNELKNNGKNIEIDGESVPAKIVAVVKNEMDNRDIEVDLSERIDQEMIDKMFPFQREGAKFAIRKKGRCLIGDDMGLGKTVQALAAASWFKEDWPILIVCPASVAVNWKNNVLDWLKFVKESEVEVFDKPKGFSEKKVVILSYDRLVKVVDDVFKRKMNIVILDESHNIKNSDAQRTRASLQISRKVKRIILLSGTPALSRPMELYTQISAINNSLFPKKHDFGIRYCDGRIKYMGRKELWDFSGCSNSQELKIILESTIMIRRLKTDVLQDLPTKRRVLVDLPLKLSEETRKKMEKFGQDLATTKSEFRNVLSDWYTETAAQKLDAVIGYLDKKLARCKKFICFGYHKVMFEGLSDYLKKKNISFILITGETPPKIRQDCCDYFQQNTSCRVALVSIVAAGIGITLTAAHEVVFTELYWNPGILTQAEDRAHRIGQEETVTIEYLLSPDTVDEYIWSVVGRKLNVLNKVGLSEDHMKSSLKRDSSQSVIEQFFSKISEEVPKEEDGIIMLN